ncbi:SMI1/KNR4 family protein [Xenorhabdus sp. SGI246]
MKIVDAYNLLNEWIVKSNGELIDLGDGELFSFILKKKFNHTELTNFESNNNLLLPDEYKDFLENVGSVDIFSSEITAGIEVLEPAEIKSFSKEVFEGYGEDLYPNLLLTTSIPKTGYFGGFWMLEESESCYSIFYPDVPPEYWIEEAEFSSFNEWIIKLVRSKSKKI